MFDRLLHCAYSLAIKTTNTEDIEMDFQTAKAFKHQLETAEKEASDALNAIKGVGCGPMGLTPDEIKFSEEYKSASWAYSSAFQALRNFNGWYVKQFKKEIREERKNKYK